MSDDLGLGNSGAAAVITGTLGKIESQIGSIVSEQVKQRDLLTRFDERQRGWATKHEVSEVSYRLEAALAPVAAQAQQAHIRLDTMVGSLASLGVQIGKLDDKLDSLISADGQLQAEVRGAWRVVKPTLGWVATIASLIVSAYVIGRYL